MVNRVLLNINNEPYAFQKFIPEGTHFDLATALPGPVVQSLKVHVTTVSQDFISRNSMYNSMNKFALSGINSNILSRC